MGRNLVIAAGLCALSIGGVAIAAGSGPPNRFASQLLDAHNSERDATGRSRLEWSGKLAHEAYQWAQVLAREGRMRHASPNERGGAGENLWMGSAGQFPAHFMVGAFIAEKKDFRPGTFPKVSRTGNWQDVGHYTQVIWDGTQQVGCAIARGRRDDFLVCRYWPAGNTYGAKID